MKTENFDTIIIGSGPAGLTAAIYNARAALKTIIVAGGQPGGQLTITTVVENFPGFVHGIGGIKLMMDMQAQVKNFGVEIRYGQVERVKHTADKLFKVELQDNNVLVAKAVIITTGAGTKWLNLPNEKELIGKGVSGCATCDGMFFRDKRVAVVGGGDTACEEADFLSRFASRVTLIHRRDSLRATALQQRKVLENPKVDVWWNSEVKEIIGKDKLEKIKVLNNVTNEEKLVDMDGLFVAVGHTPATGFVADLVELTETGHVVTGKNSQFPTMSSQEGVFAAGDCTDNVYRQAVVAAGDGAKAAIDAERWIGEQMLK